MKTTSSHTSNKSTRQQLDEVNQKLALVTKVKRDLENGIINSHSQYLEKAAERIK